MGELLGPAGDEGARAGWTPREQAGRRWAMRSRQPPAHGPRVRPCHPHASGPKRTPGTASRQQRARAASGQAPRAPPEHRLSHDPFHHHTPSSTTSATGRSTEPGSTASRPGIGTPSGCAACPGRRRRTTHRRAYRPGGPSGQDRRACRRLRAHGGPRPGPLPPTARRARAPARRRHGRPTPTPCVPGGRRPWSGGRRARPRRRSPGDAVLCDAGHPLLRVLTGSQATENPQGGGPYSYGEPKQEFAAPMVQNVREGLTCPSL